MSGGVFLNIDRIVLDGFDHVDRRELAKALQQALTEQLASLSPGHSSSTPLARTHIALQESLNAEQLGRSLATELGSVINNAGAARTAGRDSAHGAEPDA